MIRKSWMAAAAGACVLVGAWAPPAHADQVFADFGPYSFKAYVGGKCLDAEAHQLGGNGTPVQLWECLGPGQTNQRWFLRPWSMTVSGGAVGAYQLVNAANGRCLDVPWPSTGNGTRLQLWDCLGPIGQHRNQAWRYQGDYDGSYHFASFVDSPPGTFKVLDAPAQTLNQNGSPVQIWDWYGYGQKNQRWWWT
jgi:hypothetical protein